MADTVIPNNIGRFRFEKLQVFNRSLTIIHFTEILKARSRLKSEMQFQLRWVKP